MAFEKPGSFILTIYHIVGKDLPFFGFFYIVILIGFGSVISLFSNDGSDDISYGFNILVRALSI
jgi:hypothetical protein